MLIFVIIGGLVDTSKGSNIVLTGKSICGGKIFRKSTDWDRLGKVWMAQYDLVWKGRNAKGGKPYTCKTAYGQFGRECRHNNRHAFPLILPSSGSRLYGMPAPRANAAN